MEEGAELDVGDADDKELEIEVELEALVDAEEAEVLVRIGVELGAAKSNEVRVGVSRGSELLTIICLCSGYIETRSYWRCLLNLSLMKIRSAFTIKIHPCRERSTRRYRLWKSAGILFEHMSQPPSLTELTSI